jgi:hypothetical protein
VFFGVELEQTTISKGLRFNGDTGSNYSSLNFGGSAGTVFCPAI